MVLDFWAGREGLEIYAMAARWFEPSIPTSTECTCTDTQQELQISADLIAGNWSDLLSFNFTTQRKLRTSTSIQLPTNATHTEVKASWDSVAFLVGQ